jgi:hypothetical protein
MEWDVRLSPTSSCRQFGIGTVVHGNVAVKKWNGSSHLTQPSGQ